MPSAAAKRDAGGCSISFMLCQSVLPYRLWVETASTASESEDSEAVRCLKMMNVLPVRFYSPMTITWTVRRRARVVSKSIK